MKTCQVLVVDSNRDAADSTAMLLSIYGLRDVQVAYSSSAAAAIVQGGFRPDILVVETRLPHTDGYALAEQVRTTHPECQVVALTGMSRREDFARSRAAGFKYHAVKPFDPARLGMIVTGQCHYDTPF